MVLPAQASTGLAPQFTDFSQYQHIFAQAPIVAAPESSVRFYQLSATPPSLSEAQIFMTMQKIRSRALRNRDSDDDGIPNRRDLDDDNDGVPDISDAFPLNRAESKDTDQDGIGNNADLDDDNDGVLDVNDAFPLNPAESQDTDRDGIGNNVDPDDDNDGVPDADDAFPLNRGESTDTDLDGIGNNADPDDDNDSVPDTQDDFPLDAGEAFDTDKDGIGNNTDLDDDNDSVEDTQDAFPLDPAETIDTDTDGTGDNADVQPNDANCRYAFEQNDEGCFLSQLPQMRPERLVQDSQNWLHILDLSGKRVLQLNLQSRQQKPAIELNSAFIYKALIYHPKHQRVYLLANDAIHFYSTVADANQNLQHLAWFDSDAEINTIIATSDHVVIGSRSELMVFDKNGTQTDQLKGSFYSNRVWREASHQLFFSTNNWREDTFAFEVISLNAVTGKLQPQPTINSSQYTYSAGKSFLSADQATMLNTFGEQYNLTTNTWRSTPADRVMDVLSTANQQLLISARGKGYLLSTYDNDMQLQEERLLSPGWLKNIQLHHGSLLEVHVVDNKLQLKPFPITVDSDQDLVPNTSDAFPYHPAAAIDLDQDGYPDAWNSGYSDGVVADHPTLLLDEVPEQADCYLSTQLTDGMCDLHKVIGNFTPTAIQTADGVSYLLDPSRQLIHRWSAATASYLPPLRLQQKNSLEQPTFRGLAIVPAQQRLYLISGDHKLSYVDLTTEQLVPFHYVEEAKSLDPAGNFLFVESFGYSGLVLNANAQITYISRAPTLRHTTDKIYWQQANNRLYQAGGIELELEILQLNEQGKSVNYDYEVIPQLANEKVIAFSTDGSQMLTDDGALLQTFPLQRLRVLRHNAFNIPKFRHAIWLADTLITATDTKVQFWDPAGTAISSRKELPGQILDLQMYQDQLIALVQTDQGLQFVTVPMNDLVPAEG